MSRPLETEDVSTIYEDLVDTYEFAWSRQGHRSLHLEYYDEDHTEPGEAAINTMRVLSAAIGVEAGDRVLNVGCGAGEDAVWNARAHDATVVGVDIGERQLELARENARIHDLGDSIEFRRDDFQTLETVEETFDVYWALEALSHSPDRPRALERAWAVLEPEGRFGATDIFLHEAGSDERVRTVEDALGLRLGTIDSFEQDLAAAGFENVTVRDLTAGIEPCTERRRRFARVVVPVGRALRKLRIRRFSATQLDAMRASSLIHELVTEDVLGYYAVTADRGPETGTNGG